MFSGFADCQVTKPVEEPVPVAMNSGKRNVLRCLFYIFVWKTQATLPKITLEDGDKAGHS